MGDAPGRAQRSTFCTYLQRVRHEPATRWNQPAPECWKLLRLLQHKTCCCTCRAVRPWRQPLLPLLLQLGWQLTLLQLWLLKVWSPLSKQQATHASCHGVFRGGQQRMHWSHPVSSTIPPSGQATVPSMKRCTLRYSNHTQVLRVTRSGALRELNTSLAHDRCLQGYDYSICLLLQGGLQGELLTINSISQCEGNACNPQLARQVYEHLHLRHHCIQLASNTYSTALHFTCA